jgi:hypothetical protein
MDIYEELQNERDHQDLKWGGPQMDDARKTLSDWCEDIEAYVGWAKQKARSGALHEYRHRMMQVAALAVAACESYDRRRDAALMKSHEIT